jgi:hypothetical protein
MQEPIWGPVAFVRFRSVGSEDEDDDEDDYDGENPRSFQGVRNWGHTPPPSSSPPLRRAERVNEKIERKIKNREYGTNRTDGTDGVAPAAGWGSL